MSIFKLERLSMQNVASSMANVSVWLEYQYIAIWKIAKITKRQPFWEF